MKQLVIVLTMLVGYSTYADFNAALDCQGLTFTTGGDAAWFEQSDVVKTGETALRSGAISDGQRTWLETTVSGPGMVSFWWKASSESVSYDYLSISVDGERQDKIGGTNGEWTHKEVVVFGDGEHIVRWTYEKDSIFSAGQDCGWLDAVAWTAAPASMTISFGTNGGETLPNETVLPGSTYGDLPVPHHDTMVFVGWYLDGELTQKVDDEDFIIFKDHVLYAKWAIPVDVMNSENITFSADGGWYAEENAGPQGGYALSSYAYSGNNELCATVKGPGTLTFKFKPTMVDYSWWCNMYVNGDSRKMFPDFTYRIGVWQDSTVVIRGESSVEQYVKWYQGGGKTKLADFVWTPASESMTISFEINGGEAIDDVVCYASDDVRYSDVLPTPSRSGYVFVGWCLDPELSVRIDESEIIGFDDMTLYAKWGRPIEVMNRDGIEFSASERSCWYARESADTAGLYVATMFPSDVYEDDEWTGYALNVTTHGYGTLGFSMKPNSSRRDSEVRISVNGDLVEDRYYSKSSAKKKSLICLPVDSDSDNVIAIWFQHGLVSDTDERIIFSDFTWTPAPESMTVSFNMEGGSGTLGPLAYDPGDVYGDLPVPSREGCTFLGWYYNGTQVEGGDLVPFCESITLDAKWAANELDILPEAFYDIVYEAEYLNQIMTGDGTSYLEADLTWDVDWDEWDWTVSDFGRMSLLTANVSEGGFLSFEFCAPDGLWWREPDSVMGVLVDGEKALLNMVKIEGSGSHEWYRIRVYIPAGAHAVSWEFSSGAVNYDGVYTAWLRNFSFEPVAPQKDLFAWADKLVSYRSWITNDLGRFAQSYNEAIASNPTDYETRLLHAVTIIAQLAENEAIQRYAAQFGVSIDYLGMSAPRSGEQDISSWPGVNEIVDAAFAEALPVMNEALADVSAIPQDWDGAVRLAAERYHLDEDVYLDRGDTMLIRAAIEASIGLLHFTKGYDWTIDYESADAACAELDSNVLAYRLITGQTNFVAKVRDASALSASKSWIATALQRVLDADQFMRSRPAENEMHFIEYDHSFADEWEKARDIVAKALASLYGAQQIDIVEDIIGSYGSCNTSLLPDDGLVRIYLGALFSGSITQDMKPDVDLDEYGTLIADMNTLPDPTIGALLPDFTLETWSSLVDLANQRTPVFSSDAIPEVDNDSDVLNALKGSKDEELKRNITDVETYAAYREWSQSVSKSDGTAAAGPRAVKGAPNAWLSYALGSDRLVEKVITSNDVQIVSFKVEDGGSLGATRPVSFAFEVAIDGVNIGGGTVAETMLKENLKKVLGVEGATTLDASAFSSDNIDVIFDMPVDGKAKFFVTPPTDAGDSFFMRVKVK